MRRMHKKGALELSINAIVIVILAMTLLGLGLGFVRNMFKDIGSTTSKVQSQMAEQILDDLRRGDKKLSFPSQTLTLEAGGEELLAVGIKNTDPAQLNYDIRIYEIKKDSTGTIQSQINSTPDLRTSSTVQYAFFWDDTQQTLAPGESSVPGIKLRADRSAQGTKLFKIMIMDVDETPPAEYVSKTFFVKFV